MEERNRENHAEQHIFKTTSQNAKLQPNEMLTEPTYSVLKMIHLIYCPLNCTHTIAS